MTYERHTIHRLQTSFSPGAITPHAWIEYEDREGHHWAQPDAFLVGEPDIIVFEIKLTGCEKAHRQLENYCTLLSHIFRRPARGLQVCRAATPYTPGPFVTDAHEFLASNHKLATWLLPRP